MQGPCDSEHLRSQVDMITLRLLKSHVCLTEVLDPGAVGAGEVALRHLFDHHAVRKIVRPDTVSACSSVGGDLDLLLLYGAQDGLASLGDHVHELLRLSLLMDTLRIWTARAGSTSSSIVQHEHGHGLAALLGPGKCLRAT